MLVKNAVNISKKMIRGKTLLGILAAGIAGNACSSSDGNIQDKRMNIIYIMADDHTEQMISTYNSKFAHTPNIDRLAEHGVKFTNSFVANSICGPSRASLLTGKHSHKNGKINNEDY